MSILFRANFKLNWEFNSAYMCKTNQNKLQNLIKIVKIIRIKNHIKILFNLIKELEFMVITVNSSF